jgi:transcriptional regulator of NAD metabolism
MDAVERREKIVEVISERGEPVSGSYLARILNVSRQVIVQDIAVLRAGGRGIIATPQGYMVQNIFSGRYSRKVIACIHSSDEVEDELKTIIAMGGKVIDVMVEHPLYGEIKGMLMLSSIYDADMFIRKMKESVSEPLLVLTKGVHLHTIEAEGEDRLSIIEKELKRKGYLIDGES